MRVYINGGLEEIKHGSWGGICEGCLLICEFLGRRGWRREQGASIVLRGKSHCFLFESGSEHEVADFKTSCDVDGREGCMVRDVKSLRHVHRHLLMLLGT